MKLSVKKKRVATSELMGALIMIAITLVAGAAVFGWVNGQAGSSENAYGQSAAASANYLREHFAPVTSTFTGVGGGACSPKCTIANFWIFNNGQLSFTLASLQIQSAVGAPAGNFLNIIYTPTSFTAYNAGGASLGCAPNTPGFSVPGTNPIPVGTLSSSAYSVTIPTSCGSVNSITVGQGFVITMTGLYGNVVQYQLTANG